MLEKAVTLCLSGKGGRDRWLAIKKPAKKHVFDIYRDKK